MSWKRATVSPIPIPMYLTISLFTLIQCNGMSFGIGKIIIVHWLTPDVTIMPSRVRSADVNVTGLIIITARKVPLEYYLIDNVMP